MPKKKIRWVLDVEVAGKPFSKVGDQMEVEAYDVITVTVPDTQTVSVDVQPSAQAKVTFVLLSSDPKYGAGLTYDVLASNGTTGATGIALDSPQLIVGAGMIELLGTAPNTFEFTNNLGEDTDVTILVGRDPVS